MRKKAIKNLLTLVLTFSALLPLLPSPGSSPCPLCTAALSDQDWYLFDRFSGALLPLYLLLGQPGTGWFDQTNHLMQERLENGTALARFPAGAVPPAYCDRHRPGKKCHITKAELHCPALVLFRLRTHSPGLLFVVSCLLMYLRSSDPDKIIVHICFVMCSSFLS